MSVDKEFNSVKQLVLHVLENHPETRSSDNKLFVKCAEYLGATKLSDLENFGLNLITVHKVRQKIQNKERKFLPNVEVIENRNKRQRDIREYMRKIAN